MAPASLGLVEVRINAFVFVPLFFYPFLPKIIVDHVILARSFDSTEIPFPPHIEPFVSFLSGKTPMEIMVSVVVFGLALLCYSVKPKRKSKSQWRRAKTVLLSQKTR